MKLLYLDNKRDCTGCRICELACSFAHGGVFNPDLSKVIVFKDEAQGIDKPQICYHCKKHPCHEVCPVEAFSTRLVDGEAIVVINEGMCTSCGLCIEACPFDAIHLSPAGNALKCDLCGGDPACAKHCPTGIIRFGENPEKFNMKEKIDHEKNTG